MWPYHYFHSPNGSKIRTQKELQNALGEKYDLSSFDWNTGKFSNPSQKHKMSPSSDQNNAKSRVCFILLSRV